MIEITVDNIKNELSVGDRVTIDGDGPFEVSYPYWADSFLNDETDVGFDIDSDEHYGIICKSEVINNDYEIMKV